MDCVNTVKLIRNSLEDYIKSNNIKCLVLGISGGIDSSVVAALVKPVCNSVGIPLIGLSLPSNSNKESEVKCALEIGNAFCHKFITAGIEYIWPMIDNELGDISDELKLNWDELSNTEVKISQGNIKARTRMIILYGVAGLFKGMVLSTDNLTEYNLGFWTINGDVGDYAPIQTLWKSEVYDLATHLVIQLSMDGYDEESIALNNSLNQIPTDGLGITSSDFEQYGYTLDEVKTKGHIQVAREVDHILQNPVTFSSHPVIKQRKKTEFKRKIPIIISRSDLGL